MKHETAERKQDKEGKVIATRKELKYLIWGIEESSTEHSGMISNFGTWSQKG